MFHSVNGDRRGKGLTGIGKFSPTPSPAPAANKGDRGFSDQTEARIFHIGNCPENFQTR